MIAACLIVKIASLTVGRALQLDTGANTTAVCVIDSGVQTNHPDLAANLWHNPSEIPGNGIDDDGNGEHFCAGVCCPALGPLACWRPTASALLEWSARSLPSQSLGQNDACRHRPLAALQVVCRHAVRSCCRHECLQPLLVDKLCRQADVLLTRCGPPESCPSAACGLFSHYGDPSSSEIDLTPRFSACRLH